MKIWLSLLGVFLLVLLIGCGGGGGGGTGSSASGGTNGTIVRYQVEAILNGNPIDPMNIEDGQTVQFQVAGYTAANNRVVQASSNWTTTDTSNSIGTLSSNGTFQATAPGGPFTVSADSGGQPRATSYRVLNPQATVTGRFIDAYARPVAGLEIKFYDNAGNVVGSSISQYNGTFRAIVPPSSVTFDVNRNSFPFGYYKEYRYNSHWYLPPADACRPHHPVLTLGNTTSLGDIQIASTMAPNGATLPPPPPPDGCG